MRRLIYYSVAWPKDAPRPDLLWQLEVSLRSLRAYNAAVPVVVFIHGEAPAALGRIIASCDATAWRQEPYEQRLARSLPHGWQALARYPLLHKFLNFHALATWQPDQVLFLDCDTLFAGDVDELFTRYAHADCWAREEPTCGRSHYGYDPGYLDESRLADIASHEGVRVPPPFNLGVVLWNHRIWTRQPQLDQLILSYAWRFVVWMAMHQDSASAATYGESEAARFVAAHGDGFLTADDRRHALPYPSANRWILDQVALWCALGHVPELTYGDFSPGDVVQNGEFLDEAFVQHRWTVCHYFSQNRERVDDWIRQRPWPTAREARRAQPSARAL